MFGRRTCSCACQYGITCIPVRQGPSDTWYDIGYGACQYLCGSLVGVTQDALKLDRQKTCEAAVPCRPLPRSQQRLPAGQLLPPPRLWSEPACQCWHPWQSRRLRPRRPGRQQPPAGACGWHAFSRARHRFGRARAAALRRQKQATGAGPRAVAGLDPAAAGWPPCTATNRSVGQCGQGVC